MKSKLPDRSLQTNCKDCVFAVYKNQTQVDCKADRLKLFSDKVIEAYDNEKEFYVINAFCNYYRKSTWNNGVADLKRVKSEASLTFDILIDCNDMDENYAQKVEEFIKNIDYDNGKIKIVLFHTYNQPKEVYSRVSHIYTHCNKKVDIATCMHKGLYLHELLNKSLRSHHVVMHNSLIDTNVCTTLNNKVNDDLVKYITASQNGVNIYSNIAYKLEFATKQQEDYFANVFSILCASKEAGMHIEL